MLLGCARRFMATGESGWRRPAFPVDDDHLFRSMATRAAGLWTGVMNAVGWSANQPDLAPHSRGAV